MSQHHSLTINVKDQCAIDAGYWQECVEEDQTPYRLVSSPHTTMYRQVLSYLEETTRNEKIPPKSQLHFGEVAIAALSGWLDLMRADQPHFRKLVKAAVQLLPSPSRSSTERRTTSASGRLASLIPPKEDAF